MKNNINKFGNNLKKIIRSSGKQQYIIKRIVFNSDRKNKRLNQNVLVQRALISNLKTFLRKMMVVKISKECLYKAKLNWKIFQNLNIWECWERRSYKNIKKKKIDFLGLNLVIWIVIYNLLSIQRNWKISKIYKPYSKRPVKYIVILIN